MSNSSYVSASGTLTSQPMLTRWTRWATGNLEIAYLFFETLISPITNPASWADPSATRPAPAANRGGGSGQRGGAGNGGGAGGGGRLGGGGGGGGGGGRSGGGGFMSMNDLRGGGTVDGCRATCG